MEQYSRNFKKGGETKHVPSDAPPGNWREEVEDALRRMFTRPPSSPAGTALALKLSRPVFGALALAEVVGIPQVEIWLGAQPAVLEEAIRSLATDEVAEVAAWFVSAAKVAEGGLIAKPDRTDNREAAVLPFLAIEIFAITDIRASARYWGSLRLTAAEAKRRAEAVRLLQRDRNNFFDYEQFKRALEYYEYPMHHRGQGRPPVPTSKAIYQLTELNLKIFDREVYEATSALMRGFFPSRGWSVATVRTTHNTEKEKAEKEKAEKKKARKKNAKKK